MKKSIVILTKKFIFIRFDSSDSDVIDDIYRELKRKVFFVFFFGFLKLVKLVGYGFGVFFLSLDGFKVFKLVSILEDDFLIEI